MDFIYPLLAVVGEVGKTADKFNYTRNKITPSQLLFVLFGTMVTGLLIFSLFTHKPFPLLSGISIGLVIFMIIVSFGQNFFDYMGLRTKNLSFREPINDFGPILASFMAYLFFPSERNIKYVVAIIAGTIILYVGSSNRRLKLKFDSGTIYLFLGIICEAILACVYKLGLESITPFYLLLFRATGVLLLIHLFLRPNLKRLRKNQVMLGVGSGINYIIGNLSRLYSIKYLGLNFTIMFLLLGPALIYMSSSLVLKERVLPRQVIASAALLVIIVWTIYT